MDLLQNIKVRNKLLILVLIPIIGLLYFSVNEIGDKNQLSNEMSDVKTLSEFAVKASSLVHETQKERGATAGFLGSKGTKFVSELPAQRKNTDNKKQELNEFMRQMDLSLYSPTFRNNVNDALTQLDKMNSIRSRVSSLNIPAKEAIGYYTKFNNQVLSAIGEIAKLSSIADISNRAESYTNFLKSKERAGIERAVLSNTFAADSFGPGMYQKLIQLITEQNAYADAFKTLASEELITYSNNTLQGPDVVEVERLRKVAFDNATTGGFDIEATYWFSTITKKINLLKKIEDESSKQLLANAQEHYNNAQSSLYFSITISSILIIVALFLTFFIITGITKPISVVVELTRKMNNEFESFVGVVDAIATNDLTQNISQSEIKSTGIDSKDEIGILVSAIEMTLDSKNKIGNSLNQMTLNLREIVQRLNENTNQVAAAATEIASNAEQMTKGVVVQSDQVMQVSTAIEEMTATIVETSNNTSEANNVSKESSDTAGKGGEIISETIQGMHRITEVVSQSAQSIEKLAKSAEKIGEIISVIDDIADQTNLLALNAAIEAARAGEQGRGFAVVADEVRKLAERTGKATGEITQMIQGIQSETNEAVTSMEAGIKEVDTGRELTDTAGNSLNEIIQMAQRLTDMIHQIATATEEQSVAAEEISHSVEQISTVSKETAKGAEESSQAAGTLSQQAEELKSIVEQFKV